MDRWLMIAFVVLTLASGAAIVWKPDSLAQFAYIVPIIFLFIAIGAFLLLLLHYAYSLLEIRPGMPIGALGLPEGSIRAFLTIGLLVLVAVFGTFIYFESGKSASYAIVRSDVPTPSGEQLEVLRKSVGDRFVVIPRGTTADVVAAIPDTTRVDIAKQLLTMIATVLTTVIGFYFGSRDTESTPGGTTTGGTGPRTTGRGPAGNQTTGSGTTGDEITGDERTGNRSTVTGTTGGEITGGGTTENRATG
jgi:hypothetical protein